MKTAVRQTGRTFDQLRSMQFIRGFTSQAEGSVLTCVGNTKVLCTASVTEGVPRFLRESNQGWLTAEYGMLPRATHQRADREAARGKQGGRTVEIQRLIGRSLRAALDLRLLGKHTITIDCDVVQADGGTRAAAISGGCVALIDALRHMQRSRKINTDPLKHLVAAVSVGMVGNNPLLDLDYAEDSRADTDLNVVMTAQNSFIEIQGTAEGEPLQHQQLQSLLTLAGQGIESIIKLQQQALDQ